MPFMMFVPFQKYAVFGGRARRAEFWQFYLLRILWQVVIYAGLSKAPQVAFVMSLLGLVFIIPGLAVGWRRMHDVDHPGWHMLIPLYNLYLAVQPGTSGDNQYGRDPKGPGDLAQVFA